MKYNSTNASQGQGYTNLSGLPLPAGVYHQPRIQITVTNNRVVVANGGVQYGPQVSPSTNVDFTASLTFQAGDGVDYIINEDDDVYCSLEGAAFVSEVFTRASGFPS
ncbi:MAG: hypothetical protein WCA20_34320 [Candidatus Sulfotelmatobacter sp.]